MATSDEEQRAIDYQQTLRNRARYQMLAEAALRGSTTARVQLRDRWSPVTNRHQDFRIGEHQ